MAHRQHRHETSKRFLCRYPPLFMHVESRNPFSVSQYRVNLLSTICLTKCHELLQHKKRVLSESTLPSEIQLTPTPAKPIIRTALSTSLYCRTATLTNPPPRHYTITSQAYSQNDFNYNLILLHQFNLQKCLKGAPRPSSADSGRPPPPPSTPPLPPPSLIPHSHRRPPPQAP
jgi:hypothetical protein